ncbi:MAG TPA: rRNA maturation RNase YbeY [Longimicrobiales bacterium]|nr:rRNA maturation RNase YbeY [Longimicrobiales bacterium]
MIRVHVNASEPGAVPVAILERAVRTALAAEGVSDGEISLTLLGDDGIRAMNREYLDADRPTDVIAFALHDPEEPVLGDVYLGLAQAARQARDAGVGLDEELVRLAVHGTLHVLGWDHPGDEGREESEMYRVQERLVRRVLDHAAESG